MTQHSGWLDGLHNQLKLIEELPEKPIRITTAIDSETPNSQFWNVISETTLTIIPAIPNMAYDATTILNVDKMSTRNASRPLITIPRTALLTNAFSVSAQANPCPPDIFPLLRPAVFELLPAVVLKLST